MSVGATYPLVVARLRVIFQPLAGWTVHATPPDATGFPAVWAELAAGGGASFDYPTLTPLVVRIVAVVAPQPTPAQHQQFADVIDALDAGFLPPLASDVATSTRTWTIDTAEVGGADRDAVLYDLALAHSLTC